MVACSCLLLIALLAPAYARDKFVIKRAHTTANAESNATSSRRALMGLGSGFWSVQGTDFVDGAGNVVRFSGVNWSGFETPKGVFGGLHIRTYGDHLDQMMSLGFSVIRLPFAGESLQAGAMPALGMVDANPDLKGLTSLEILDKMVMACAERGIKIILDYHRMHRTFMPELGTWFDDETPESVWLDNWAMLATRYQGIPTVIGVDLFNEVHAGSGFPGPFWLVNAGANEMYNWRRAVLRAISVIHAIEPNWIIFLEGTYKDYWWGGNCMDLLSAPIIGPAGKIAYSAHDYGPYVFDMSQFHAPDFPANLKGVFREHWGSIVEDGVGPLWVGEFGSFYPPSTNDRNARERAVFEQQISYIGDIKASWTISFWGPDTGDTGSILNDDWTTVNEEKMKILAPIMRPEFI